MSEEEQVACAPESGQPMGGRANPWDDDEEEVDGAPHAFPTDHHCDPGDDL